MLTVNIIREDAQSTCTREVLRVERIADKLILTLPDENDLVFERVKDPITVYVMNSNGHTVNTYYL